MTQHKQNDSKRDMKNEPSALDEARSADAVPGDQQLPPFEHGKRGEPGTAGDPHHGQAGHAGSGKDAQLESVGQSQSDRAAGKSK